MSQIYLNNTFKFLNHIFFKYFKGNNLQLGGVVLLPQVHHFHNFMLNQYSDLS